MAALLSNLDEQAILMRSTHEVGDYFKSQPIKRHIHILVQRGESFRSVYFSGFGLTLFSVASLSSSFNESNIPGSVRGKSYFPHELATR